MEVVVVDEDAAVAGDSKADDGTKAAEQSLFFPFPPILVYYCSCST